MLQFNSPVQGGEVHVVGDRQDPAEAPSISGDRVPSQSHRIEPTTGTQVTVTPTSDPILQSPDVVSQMSDIIRHVGQQLADSIVACLNPAHSVPTSSTSVVHD